MVTRGDRIGRGTCSHDVATAARVPRLFGLTCTLEVRELAKEVAGLGVG